jgi:hypothetical protein
VNTKTRDALLGACFCALVAGAVLYVNVAHPERQARFSYTLKACFEDLSRCRSEPIVRLNGAYAPGTLIKNTPGCEAEFDLQSPGGDPPGKVHVCAELGSPNLEMNCASTRGALHVTVEGHFDGASFLARRTLSRAADLTPCTDTSSH